MKILIFTEGTILMHKNAVNHSREEIVKQVKDKQSSIKDYHSYVPIGNSPQKISRWKEKGAEIYYLTSRTKFEEIADIKIVLKKYHFPDGELYFCQDGEGYSDIVERLVPDILIEDDCESIGEEEIIINNIKPEIKKKIKSIIVKEFAGIDHLPDNIQESSSTRTKS